jgi:hypothetical protein
MYGIINKATKEYFSGFSTNGQPSWNEGEYSAYPFPSKLFAESQALLLAQTDENVQRKAVKL